MHIVRWIILHQLPVASPGRKIPIAGEAVIRQMTCPAVAQIHHMILTALVNTVGVFALLRIVRQGHTVPEADLPVGPVRTLPQDLIEMRVGIVDHQRGCPREILVGPGICQNVHGDACRRQSLPFGCLHGVRSKTSAGAADQPVLIAVPFAAAHLRVQIPRKKMKRCPDPGDVLQPDHVRPRVHQLQLQLGGGSRQGTADPAKEGPGTQIHQLGAVADLKAFFMGMAGQKSGAVCCVVMKILLHDQFSIFLRSRRTSMEALIISASARRDVRSTIHDTLN